MRLSSTVADLRWHPFPQNGQILCKVLCLSHENEINNQASHTFYIPRKIKNNIFDILLLSFEELIFQSKKY